MRRRSTKVDFTVVTALELAQDSMLCESSLAMHRDLTRPDAVRVVRRLHRGRYIECAAREGYYRLTFAGVEALRAAHDTMTVA